MQHMSVGMHNRDGALLRLIGLVERRGFRVQGLDTEVSMDGTRMDVALTMSGRGRDVENLSRQVQKLFDVYSAVAQEGDVA